MFHRAVLCVTLTLVLVLGLSNPGEAQRSIGMQVNANLGLEESSIASLGFALDAETGLLYTDVPVSPTETWTLELYRYSLRADDFQAYEDVGNGQLVEVPAPPIVTWRGSVLQQPGAIVVATYYDDQLWAHIHATNGLWAIQPLSETGLPGNPGDHVIYRGEHVQESGHECGVVATGLPTPPTGAGPAPQGTGLEVADLGLDADFEYFQANGSSVVATINDMESLINAVEGIYDNDPIEIVYEITTVIVRSSPADPYTTSNPDAAVAQFRGVWSSPPEQFIRHDLAHLFTGKNLDGTTIGIADGIGTVCTAFKYALSEAEFSTNFTVRTALVAHELGHLWGGIHCDGQAQCRIMCSIIASCNGLAPLTFAPGPQGNIVAYRNSIGGCLFELPDAQPIPFEETWPTTVVSGERWSYNDGGSANSGAMNEISPPLSLNLDGQGSQLYQNDEIRSNFILGAGTSDLFLQYYTQHRGVEAGETLTVQYLNSLLDWVTVNTITSDGVDQDSFEIHTHDLPAAAQHDSLRIRFVVEGNESNDDWYIDDITVTDGMPMTGPPEITFLDPAAGPSAGGVPVIVNGSNFTADATVLFGSTPLVTTFISSGQLQGITVGGISGTTTDVFVTQTSGVALLPAGYLFTDDSLRAESTTVAPGATDHEVRIFATHQLDLVGFGFGLDFDGDLLTVTDVTEIGTTAEGADFFQPALNNEDEPDGGFITVGAVISFMNMDSIPAGTDNVVAIVTYDVSPTVPDGTLTIQDITDGLGDPPVAVNFVLEGQIPLIPGTVDGITTIQAGGTFIRGDCDGDQVFNGLVDGIAILNFQFAGIPVPPCVRSCDADGDGIFNGLIDGLRVLNFQFITGSPPPAAPYPGCGADNGSPLTCDTSTCP